MSDSSENDMDEEVPHHYPDTERSGIVHRVNLEDDLHKSQRPNEESMRRMKRRMGVTAEDTPHDVSFRPGLVQLYSPPMQRQRWGETQVLPRVNWGDLFFDLFYVAATYNVSNIIIQQPDAEGILYATGTFLPLMGFWTEKVFYDGRFAVREDDVFHRLYTAAQLCVLGLAVLHTRPVDIMSNSAENSSMFIFSLCLVLERILAIGLYVELYFKGVGQQVIRNVARMTSARMMPQIAVYLGATVIAGVEFWSDDGVLSNRRLAEESTDKTSLAFESPETTFVPILLCLGGYVMYVANLIVTVVCCFPGGGRHKDQ